MGRTDGEGGGGGGGAAFYTTEAESIVTLLHCKVVHVLFSTYAYHQNIVHVEHHMNNMKVYGLIDHDTY